jgi:cob(I)alamin adenosyltransferase
VRYLNRLSDLLFILGRAANRPSGDGTASGPQDAEALWEPGAHESAHPGQDG